MEHIKTIVHSKFSDSFNLFRDSENKDFFNTGIYLAGGGALMGYLMQNLTDIKGCGAFGTIMGCGMAINYLDEKNRKPSRIIIHNKNDKFVEEFEGEISQ